MYLSVKEVFPEPDYTLILKYSDGDKRRFDMKPYLDKGIFQDLKDFSKFKSVRLCFDTVEWENKADFDPVVLFEDSVKL
jgi:hypothetical protein